jgi:ribosomal protein S18 acetylase RimI-like enzyme
MGDAMQIRQGDDADLGFLEAMLFEAFHWDVVAAERPPLASFRDEPEFRKLLAGWGRAGDRLLVAEDGGIAAGEKGERLGAAWFRLWTAELHSYGFVAPEVPELGLAVVGAHRSRGVGRALLRELIDLARADGWGAVSLSVSPANRALELYLSEGFVHVGESGTSWTLVRDLSSRASPA